MDVLSLYEKCTLCPHHCGVNRNEKFGFCKEGAVPNIVWTGLHKGEEAPVSGEHGSGMLFFRGCTLGCPTCQNIQISSNNGKSTLGTDYSIDGMARKMLSLQKSKAATISFVTAEHFAPSLVEAIKKARSMGLTIPTVFNTSGFMTCDTIDLLLPYIDIWLWDTKTLSSSVAKKYFGSKEYPGVEEASLSYLCSKVNSDEMESSYPKGIIVRHLVLPSHLEESKAVIRNFGEKYKDKCYFSLMYQFIPPTNADGDLLKPITKEDTEELEDLLFSLNIENGFIQELSENEEVWRPDFTRDNPFPSNFAKPII